MLDFFTILTKGGLVLWWYQDQLVQHLAEDFAKRINDLIHSAMLEGSPTFNKDNMTLKYKLDNEFDLVFIVGYQTQIKISYAEKFLDAIQKRFRDKYANLLAREYCFNLFNNDSRFGQLEGFAACFDEEYDRFRGNAVGPAKMKTFSESNKHKNKTIASLHKGYGNAGKGASKQAAIAATTAPQSNTHADNSTGNTTDSTGSSSENGMGENEGEQSDDEDDEDNESFVR